MARNDKGQFVNAFDGAFMQPDVYPGEAYIVDGPAGVDVVPIDVFGRSVVVCGDRGQLFEPIVVEGVGIEEAVDAARELAREIADYIENDPNEVWTVARRRGWIGRVSAPGYMDCSPWHFDTNKRRLMATLRELYGND